MRRGLTLAGAAVYSSAMGRIRRGPGTLYRRLKSLEYLVTRDRRAVLDFLAADLPLSRARRVALIGDFVRVTNAVRGYHTLSEMLTISRAILARAPTRTGAHRELTVVEAGCGYGASSAKLSLAVRAASGHLHVFDSFRGIPPNDEEHVQFDGRPVIFRTGAFRGNLRSVQRTLARHGAPRVCTLHKGWFADTLPATLPGLRSEIDIAILDVDLVASTRTCLVELFPRMRPDGVLFSLDGQLRATHALLGDADFWTGQVGVPQPVIHGLGRDKLLAIHPAPASQEKRFSSTFRGQICYD